MKSEAMWVRPVNEKNIKALGGCDFVETIQHAREPWKGSVVMIFNDPYLKTNIDLVFVNGRMYISDKYGETMNRNEVDYAGCSGGED